MKKIKCYLREGGHAPLETRDDLCTLYAQQDIHCSTRGEFIKALVVLMSEASSIMRVLAERSLIGTYLYS